MIALPPLFLERLRKIIPGEHFETCCETFLREKVLSARVNTLKTNLPAVLDVLQKHHIDFKRIAWHPEALILRGVSPRDLEKTELLQKGFLYIQSLSSMLPAVILDPKPGERVLDMCAAPGSKTTHMASLMGNTGFILAVDNVKERYYKLRSIISLLGAHIVEPRFFDARRLRAQESFDKILLDAPCSSEGRFTITDQKTYSFWSGRKIKEMVQKQRGLLFSASRLLKKGGTIVYSTCTFAPEENEGVLSWLLKKTGGTMKMAQINFGEVARYPAVIAWGKKVFPEEVSLGFRVLPDGVMEGFFIAKLIKAA